MTAMHPAEQAAVAAPPIVDYRTEPGRYKHWKLAVDGAIATLSMAVAEDGGIRPG